MNELTEIQKKNYKNATICHICEEKLTSAPSHILSWLKSKNIDIKQRIYIKFEIMII